jgi:hypothetical protein
MRKARLKLANGMAECPRCWENFVRACQQARTPPELDWSLSDEEFEQALKPYNARVHFGHNKNYVAFDTVEDRTLFVLRWS